MTNSTPAVEVRYCECHHADAGHADEGEGPCEVIDRWVETIVTSAGVKSFISKAPEMVDDVLPCTCQQFRLHAVKFEGSPGRHELTCPCWRCQDGLLRFPSPSAALIAEASVLSARMAESAAAYAQDQIDQRVAGRAELADLTPRRWIAQLPMNESPSYRSSMQDAGRGGLLR